MSSIFSPIFSETDDRTFHLAFFGIKKLCLFCSPRLLHPKFDKLITSLKTAVEMVHWTRKQLLTTISLMHSDYHLKIML